MAAQPPWAETTTVLEFALVGALRLQQEAPSDYVFTVHPRWELREVS